MKLFKKIKLVCTSAMLCTILHNFFSRYAAIWIRIFHILGQNATAVSESNLQKLVLTTNVPVQTTFAHDLQSPVITVKHSETSTANSAASTVATSKDNNPRAALALNYTEPKTFATTSEHSEKCIISTITATTVPTTTAKTLQVQKDSITGSSGSRDTRESINRLKQALLSPNMGSVFTHASTAGQQLEEKYGYGRYLNYFIGNHTFYVIITSERYETANFTGILMLYLHKLSQKLYWNYIQYKN